MYAIPNITTIIQGNTLIRCSTLTGEISHITRLHSSYRQCEPMPSFTSYDHLKRYSNKLGIKQTHQLQQDHNLYLQGYKHEVAILKLIDMIKYLNVVFIARDTLRKLLDVNNNSNLNRTLNTLSSLDLLSYKAVKNKQIRVTINPRLAFKGSDHAKRLCLYDWDKDHSCNELSPLIDFDGDYIKEVLAKVKQIRDNPININETDYIDPLLDDMNSVNNKNSIDRLHAILTCSSVQFRLFMLGERVW